MKLAALTLFVLLVPNQARLDTLRAEGYEALFNLDYETAHKRFQQMIDLAPDHPAGPECYAMSLWVQQLNEQWKLRSTLYSDSASDAKTRVDRKQSEEFHNWTRQAKQLAQARLRKNPKDVEALYTLG